MKFPKQFPITILAVLLAVSFVSAGWLDLALQPFGGINFGMVYMRYVSFFDAVIFMILFLSVAQFTFSKIYKNGDKPAKEAKMVSVAVGLALTVGMMVFENTTGFYIGKIGSFAALVFFLVLSYFFFSLIKSFMDADETATAVAITILVMYGILSSAFGPLLTWMNQNIPILVALLNIAIIISFIILIMRLIKLFPKGEKKPEETTDGKKPSKLPEEEAKKPPAKVPPEDIKDAIKITIPANGAEYVVGKPLDVAFEVDGYGFGNGFDYEIVFQNGVLTPPGRVGGIKYANPIARDAIPATLPIGQYDLWIVGYKPGSSEKIAQSEKTTFKIAPPVSGSLQKLIAQFQNELNALDGFYRLNGDWKENYVLAFGRIIAQHHIAKLLSDAKYEPTAADFAQLLYVHTKIIGQAKKLNDLIIAIKNDREYPYISAEAFNTLNNALSYYTQVIIGIKEFDAKARESFNKREPIIPEPKP